jgi:membrane fusion protein (multidrug efflux system)
MDVPKVDWNKVFEFAWRILVFIVAIGIVIVVSTNWTRWEGGAGWQRTNDAYLQADLTPISAKVAGYVRDLPIQDYEHVHKGQLLAQLVDDDYRAAVAQAEAGVATALAQDQALKAQRELQLANVEAARAVVASTTASSDQNDRDLARQRRLLETGSSSIEASEKLTTTHAQLEAQSDASACAGAGCRAPTRGPGSADRPERGDHCRAARRHSMPPGSISATPASRRLRTE